MTSFWKRWRERREREIRDAEEFEQRYDDLETELWRVINPLPLQEAERRAKVLLFDTSKFTIVKASLGRPLPLQVNDLAPQLQKFFTEFDRVWQPQGTLLLARNAMEPSIVGQGLITIGDLGGEHCHLAVLPGGETVYDVDEEEDYEGRLPERWYTSVYHCIVYASREQAVLFQR